MPDVSRPSGLPSYVAGAQTYEDELLARWCFDLNTGAGHRWAFQVGGGAYEREDALSIIRACLGLGVDPQDNVSALALAAVYARIERLEQKSLSVFG